jgi:hypothetical protein
MILGLKKEFLARILFISETPFLVNLWQTLWEVSIICGPRFWNRV